MNLVVAAIVGLAAAITTNFGGIRDKIVDTFGKIFAKFDEAEGNFNGFKVAAEAIWSSFAQIFELAMDAVISALGFVVNAIANWVKIVGDMFNIVIAVFTGDWKGALDGFKSLALNVFTLVTEAVRDFANFFIEIGENLVQGWSEGVKNSFAKARQTIEDLGNAIIGWFKGILGISSPSTVFAEMGMQVVQGLINGLGDMWNAARDKVQGLASSISNWFANTLRIKSPSLDFLSHGADIVAGLVEGIVGNTDKATDAAKKLAKATQDAFNEQIKNLDINLALGIINPEQALSALEKMGKVLQKEMDRLTELGQNGTKAFRDVAANAKIVEDQIGKVNKRIDDNIKATHGVTEATKAWLTRLTTEADLGFKKLEDVFNMLETRAKEVFAEMEQLQEQGLNADNSKIFAALAEKHALLLQNMSQVEGKILEIDKQEQQMAADAITRGDMLVSERISDLEQRLESETLTVKQIEQLETELAARKKALAEQEEAFEEAFFQSRKARGLTTEQEEIAHLQAIVDKHKRGTAERENAELALHNAIKGFEQERLDFQGAVIQKLKAQGQNVIALEIDLAQQRLALTKESTIEREQILAQIATLEAQRIQEQQALLDKQFQLAKLRGEQTLADEIAREQQKLAVFTGSAQERIGLEIKIANLEKTLADQSSQARIAAFNEAKEQGSEATQAIIDDIQRRLDANEGTVFDIQALEENLTQFTKEQSKLRTEEDKKEQAERTKDEETAAKEREAFVEAFYARQLALGEISRDDHLKNLKARLVDLKANKKEETKEYVDLQNEIDKIEKEITDEKKKQEDKRRENVKKNLKKQEEFEEALHARKRALGEISDKEELARLKKELSNLQKHHKSKTKEFVDLQNEITKLEKKISDDQAKELKKREDNAKKNAKKREEFEEAFYERERELGNISLREHLENLREKLGDLQKHHKSRTEEAINLKNEIDRVEKEITENEREEYDLRVAEAISAADRKLVEQKDYADEYIAELERIMKDENTSLDDRIEIAKKLAEFKIEKAGEVSTEEIDFLQDILDEAGTNAEDRKKINEALTDLLKGNAEEVREKEEEAAKASEEAWKGAVDEITKGIDSIADALKDISPVAAGVVTFIGDFAKSIGEHLDGAGLKAVSFSDAIGAIGAAAQNSSDIAIKALGQLASSISQFASGNIIGGIVGGINAVVSGIGAIFGKSKRRAEELRKKIEELNKTLEELDKFLASIATGFSNLGGVFKDVKASDIEFDIISILPNANLTDLTEVEKKFIDTIFGFRKRVGESLQGAAKAIRVQVGVWADALFNAGTDLSIHAEGLLGNLSDFAGGYAAEIIRIEDALSRVEPGSFQSQALIEELDKVTSDLEAWGDRFTSAMEFLSGDISSALFDLIKDPEVTLDEASQKLGDAFRDTVLRMMAKMATDAVLATGIIAGKIADLAILVEKAIVSGDWSEVTQSVAETSALITDALGKAHQAIKEGVELMEDIDIDVDVNVDANVAVDTSTNVDTSDGEVADSSGETSQGNSSDTSSEEFGEGVDAWGAFSESFGNELDEFVENLNESLEVFTFGAEELTNAFLPELSTEVGHFGSHIKDFGGHVNTFGMAVGTFERSVNQNKTDSDLSNKNFRDSVDKFTRNIDRLAFSDVKDAT